MPHTCLIMSVKFMNSVMKAEHWWFKVIIQTEAHKPLQAANSHRMATSSSAIFPS